LKQLQTNESHLHLQVAGIQLLGSGQLFLGCTNLSGWGLQVEQAKSQATFDQIWLSGNDSLKGALSLLTTSRHGLEFGKQDLSEA
jgi:hypothetical protein